MITVGDVHNILDKYFKRYKLKVYRSETFPERIVLYGTSFWEFGLDDCITKREAEEQILDNLLCVCEEMKDLFAGIMGSLVRLKRQQKHIDIKIEDGGGQNKKPSKRENDSDM